MMKLDLILTNFGWCLIVTKGADYEQIFFKSKLEGERVMKLLAKEDL